MVASDTPAAGIDQRVELRRDLRQRGQAAVVEHGGQQVLRGVGQRRACTTEPIDVDDLRRLDPRVVGKLQQLRVGGHVGQRLHLLRQRRAVGAAALNSASA